MIFANRVTALVPGAPIRDMFGNEYPGKPTRVRLDAPVAMQQRTSMEKEGGEWVHRVSSECMLISAPGWHLREITAASSVEVDGWPGTYQVQGEPVHYEHPVKHSEIKLRKVEG